MTVAVGIIWRWLYDEKVGLINYVAPLGSGSSTSGIAFLDSFDWAMPAVIVAAIWQIVGFFMIILLTGLQSIPQNLYEAAAIDGAGRRARLPGASRCRCSGRRSSSASSSGSSTRSRAST